MIDICSEVTLKSSFHFSLNEFAFDLPNRVVVRFLSLSLYLLSRVGFNIFSDLITGSLKFKFKLI